MQYIIGTYANYLPTWRRSLEYDLRIEQVGKEQAFYEMMQQQFGLDLEEEERMSDEEYITKELQPGAGLAGHVWL